MKRRSNHTQDPARVARAVKKIEGRLSDVEADARNQDDPTPVHRQSLHGVRLTIEDARVRRYTQAQIDAVVNNSSVFDSWDDADSREKTQILFEADHTDTFALSSGTTTEGISNVLARSLAQQATHEHADAVRFGSGSPDIQSTGGRLGSQHTQLVPIGRTVQLANDQPRLNFVADFNTFDSGETITEMALEATSDDTMVIGEFGSSFSQGDYVLGGRIDIGIHPDDSVVESQSELETDAYDVGTTGAVFTNIAAHHITAMPLINDDPGEALVDDADADLETPLAMTSEPEGEIPIVDVAMFDGDLFMQAFADATRLNDRDLQSWGIIDYDEYGDGETFVTLSQLQPPVSKSVLETVTFEARFVFEYASI